MEIRHVNTFLKVSELGNFTKAAEQLGYSQASVTAHIHQLESDLGVTLFDRNGRGVKLTDAGRKFVPYAANLIKACEDAESFAVDMDDPCGDLTIEASSSLAIGVLPRLIIKFRELYPHVRVSVGISEDSDVLISRVRQSRIDFAFILEHREDFEGCIKAVERYEKFVFAAPPSDPITRDRHVPVRDVTARDFVSIFVTADRSAERWTTLDEFLDKAGYDFRSDIEIGSNAAVLAMLVRGKGRAFLPLFMIEEHLANGSLSMIDTADIDSGMYSQLLYSENRWINPQMKAFIDFMNKELG